jgi:hypothetical protein
MHESERHYDEQGESEHVAELDNAEQRQAAKADAAVEPV